MNKRIHIIFVILFISIQASAQTWTVTVNSGAGGHATGGGVYSEFDFVMLQAVPDDGYIFDFWSGDINSINDNLFFMMSDYSRNITVTASFAALGSLFATKVNYTVGSSPIYLINGDFNGDNKLDLAVVNQSSTTVSVLLGIGDGTFQAKVDYATGSNPISVTSTDFNGDNNKDLAVANYSVATVSVFIGNGNGTFQAKVDYATGANPYDVTTNDFNGDNIPDLVTANAGSSNASVLLGNGNGTFQAKVDYATGSGPRSITTGDVNGDNRIDLAVGSYSNSAISILLGNGNGTFNSYVNYATGGNNYSPKVYDFNGDNKLDVAAVNVWENTVSVLLGNGDGTFQAKVDYAAGGLPYRLTVGDFNQDSKADLAIAAGDQYAVFVLHGNGNGTFQAKEYYSVGSSPFSITSGDFNGDGVPDIAAGNNGNANVSVLINSTTPLPVELTLFTASLIKNKVSLNWTTATEVNNYGFDVERKLINSDWTKIGFVQGHGNSNAPKNYFFMDNTPVSSTIKYRLKQIDFDGKYEYSDIVEAIVETPAQFSLEQNYPNPFNPVTTIRYSIPNVGTGFSLSVLKIYDILGNEVVTLVNEQQSAGNYEVKFDASHAEHGRSMASGVYFYKLQSGSFVQVKKLIIMK